jgi:inorganic pyrophosphatase
LHELDETRLDEIEHFFRSYNEMEGRQFKALARQGVKEAEAILNACMIS